MGGTGKEGSGVGSGDLEEEGTNRGQSQSTHPPPPPHTHRKIYEGNRELSLSGWQLCFRFGYSHTDSGESA